MIMSKQLFERGKSSNGGWNTEQVTLLGESMKNSGWAKRCVGKDYPEEIINEFIALKDAHFRRKLDAGFLLKKKVKKRMQALQFVPVNHPLPYAQQYLHPNWQKMRTYILDRDKYTCVDCGRVDLTLHVHHLKYGKDMFIWQVPVWYLVTLCEDCHSKEHQRDLRAKR